MQDEFKVYLLLLVAEPTHKGLGRQLLRLLLEGAQAAYDESPLADGLSHGKATMVVFAPETHITFYLKCGYRTISELQRTDGSVACKHRYSPWSDLIRDFEKAKHPTLHIADTTIMLLCIRRRTRMINGFAPLEEMDKSDNPSLVGAYVHIQLTLNVKKSLSLDIKLKEHLDGNEIYKNKCPPVYILALVTAELGDGTYDVLVCIDNDGVQNNKDNLSEIVKSSR